MINPYAWKRFPPWLWNLLCRYLARIPSWDLDDLTYVVLDTETTGFDFEKDRILCIGALRLRKQQIDVKDSFEVFLAQEHYNRQSTPVHGILSKEEHPCLPEEVALDRFVAFIGQDILVAHHSNFDLTMINNALLRHGRQKLTNRVLDTSVLYRKTIINSPLVLKKDRYSLDELADKFDISKKDRHTALGDAYITALAFIRILIGLRKKGITTLRQALR